MMNQIYNQIISLKCSFFEIKDCFDWLEDVDRVNWSDNQIKELIKIFEGEDCEGWIWYFVVMSSAHPIPVFLAQYLERSDFAVDAVAHTEQSKEVLEIFKNKSDEVSSILGVIYYESEEYNVEYFESFIREYESHLLMQRLIHAAPSHNIKKEIYLSYIIKKRYIYELGLYNVFHT